MRTNLLKRGFLSRLAAFPLALGLALSCSTCEKIDTTTFLPFGEYAVSGTVTSSSKGLEGVSVTSGSAKGTSNSQGRYQISLPAGTHDVRFEKTGYSNVSKSVTVGSEPETTLNVVMTSSGSSGTGNGSGDGTGSGSSGSGGSSFTVTNGAYQRVHVTGPGKISFTVVGIDMDLDKDAWPIVYFYDSKGYTGGKGGSGGFNGELRTYKLKFYDASGVIASEDYYVEPKGNTPRWQPTVARNVTLEWGSNYVQSTVDGIPFRKYASIASSFTVGIGFPPSVRPGWTGAVYTNIQWPAGTTPSGN